MTELVFILDRSTSMKKLVSDTIGGFNSMIKRQQDETDGNALVSTVLFNQKSFVLHDRIPLAEIKPLTDKDYQVGGVTALLDAEGSSLKHTKKIILLTQIALNMKRKNPRFRGFFCLIKLISHKC